MDKHPSTIDPETGACNCCGEIVSGSECEQCRECDGLGLRSRTERHRPDGEGPRYDRDQLTAVENN